MVCACGCSGRPAGSVDVLECCIKNCFGMKVRSLLSLIGVLQPHLEVSFSLVAQTLYNYFNVPFLRMKVCICLYRCAEACMHYLTLVRHRQRCLQSSSSSLGKSWSLLKTSYKFI
jgi:hypothetical protein